MLDLETTHNMLDFNLKHGIFIIILNNLNGFWDLFLTMVPMWVLVLPKSSIFHLFGCQVFLWFHFCQSIITFLRFKEIGREGRNDHETHLQEGPMFFQSMVVVGLGF